MTPAYKLTSVLTVECKFEQTCVCVNVRISVQLMKVNNFIRFVPFKSISDLQLLPPSCASSTTVLTSDQSVHSVVTVSVPLLCSWLLWLS